MEQRRDGRSSGTRRAWAISIVAALGIAISFFDRQTMSVLAPIVTQALSITDVEYGVLGSVFALAMLLGSAFAGWWTARLGARRAFALAVLVWSAVAVLHSLALGFASLLVLRAALGFTESPTVPAAMETVESVLPAASRPRGTGLLFVGSSLGVLVAAPIAVALEQQFGWRVAFLTTGALAAVLWVPAWWLLTARVMVDRPAQPERRRLANAFAVLAEPATLRMLAVTAGVMPLIAFTTFWEGKWLVQHFKLPRADLGHYLILGPLLFDTGAFLFGDLASRRLLRRTDTAPPRLLFAIAATCIVGGDLAAALVAPNALYAIALNGVAAVGRGAILPLIVSDLNRRIPPALVAPASSAFNGMQALAMVVANPIIGYVVANYGYPSILAGLALWLVVPAVFWLVTSPVTKPPD